MAANKSLEKNAVELKEELVVAQSYRIPSRVRSRVLYWSEVGLSAGTCGCPANGTYKWFQWKSAWGYWSAFGYECVILFKFN